MADCRDGERSSLGKFAKSQSRYGTTSKFVMKTNSFVKHTIKSDETIQGIALKYGATMEQIKRVNNIWTNDSLFLRDFLLIPITRNAIEEIPAPLGCDHPEVSMSASAEKVVRKQDYLHSGCIPHSNSKVNCLQRILDDSITENSTSRESNPKDFLMKFDLSLKKIRSSVQKLEEHSNFPEDSSNPLNHLPVRKSSRCGTRNKSLGLENENGFAEPELVIKSCGTCLLSSVEECEKQQDNMFQL